MGGFFCNILHNLYYDFMQKYVFLLGREPLLSMAELQSLFPSVERSGDFALIQAEKEDIE